MKKYFDDEIRNSISELSEEDRLLVIESLFNGMLKAMTAFYETTPLTNKEISTMLDIEVDAVKSLIKTRLNAIREMEKINTPVNLESDPKVATDKFFEFDAKIDFQRLMEAVSGSRKSK